MLAAIRTAIGPRVALGLILVVYFTLGVVYSVANPVFEAPDEHWHFAFVRHVAAGRGLPVLHEDARLNVAGGEGGQPPLYYLLGAVLTSWISSGDIDQYVEPNPSGSRGYPSTVGNKNVWIQLKPDTFPWKGEYLAAHLLRGLSLLLGALTVLATYGTARELFPRRPEIWLAAAGVNAFVPQFLFITAAVSNDLAAAATGAGVLYLTARTITRRPSLGRSLLLGVVLGLAILSKLSLLVSLPFSFSALAVTAWRRGERVSQFSRQALYTSTAVLAVAGWWYARNWLLYRDPLGLVVFLRSVGSSGEFVSVPIGEIVADLPGLKASFWALFGWFSIMVDREVYAFFDALAAAGLIGLGLHCWRVRRDVKALGRVILPAALAVLVFASLVRFRMAVPSFQGRLLFPAISALAVLLALGLSSLAPRRVRWPVIATLLTGMLAVSIAAPFRYIVPAYAPQPPVGEDELSSLPRQMQVIFGSGLELVGFSPARPQAAPDGRVNVDLYWRARAPMAVNYTISIQVFDSDGRRLAQDDSHPGRGTTPTSRWRSGDVFRDSRVLRLAEPPTTATTGKLVVSVYRYGGETLLATDRWGESLGPSPTIGRIKLGLPRLEDRQTRPLLALGKQVALLDHTVDSREIRVGDKLHGKLTWQALQPLPLDYTVFVQLIGPEGLVGQHDSQPLGGAYPMSWWEPGEVVVDSFVVPTDDARPGDYRLIAGLYDSATGIRLRGPERDHLDLGHVSIVDR